MASAATDRGTAGFLNSGLQRASREAAIKREELDILLSEEIGRYTSHDTSLVVFGSLARGEWTSGSDLDWTYLIDGEANSDHLTIVQQIQNVLQQKRNKQKFRPPSPAGAFGNMAFSHDIIHRSEVITTPTRTPLGESCCFSNHKPLARTSTHMNA